MSHEFKVMGLAPYAKPKYGLKTYELIKNWFKVVPPFKFENRSGFWKWQYIGGFEKLFRTKHRFDNIAWAAQNLIEEKQTEWIKMVIKNTGIKNVVLSGGVFLNIKANYNLLQIDEIENLFIFPSGGDESLPMGAALQLQIENGQEYTEPLGPLYFGDEFSDEQILDELKLWSDSITFVKPDNINEHAANELINGNIIARFLAEWSGVLEH